MCDDIWCDTLLIWETREPGGLPSLTEGYPPDKGKEGDANVCYIFGVNPDRYLLGDSCVSVLSDIQG